MLFRIKLTSDQENRMRIYEGKKSDEYEKIVIFKILKHIFDLSFSVAFISKSGIIHHDIKFDNIGCLNVDKEYFGGLLKTNCQLTTFDYGMSLFSHDFERNFRGTLFYSDPYK